MKKDNRNYSNSNSCKLFNLEKSNLQTNTNKDTSTNMLKVGRTLKVNFLIDGHKYTELIDTRESIKNFAYKLSIKYQLNIETILSKFMTKFEQPAYLINLIKCNVKMIDQEGKFLICFKTDKKLSPKRNPVSPYRSNSKSKDKSRDKTPSPSPLKRSKSQTKMIIYKTLSEEKLKKKSVKILTQKEKEDEEYKNCTFSPNIKSNKSNESNTFKNYSQKSLNIEVFKNNKIEATQIDSNRNKQKVNKTNKDDRDNKIKPLKKSSSSCKNLAHFYKLYNDSHRIRDKIEKYSEYYYKEICSFSPKINDKSPSNLNNFFNRLQSWIDRKNEKTLKSIDLQNIDTLTGTKFFSPRLNKNSKYYKMVKTKTMPNLSDKKLLIYPETEEINNYLKLRKEQEESNTIPVYNVNTNNFFTNNLNTNEMSDNILIPKNKSLSKERYDLFCNSNPNWKTTNINIQSYAIENKATETYQNHFKFKVAKKSQEINKNAFQKAFSIIFESLDYNNQNILTGTENIINSNLPNKIKKIIAPLLIELEQEKETLNQIEFILVCEDLLKEMKIYDRNTIEEYYHQKCSIRKKDNPYKYHTFRPKINTNSEKMIKKIEGEDILYNKYNIKLAQDKPNSQKKLNIEIEKIYSQTKRYI